MRGTIENQIEKTVENQVEALIIQCLIGIERIRGAFLGVPIKRVVMHWGVYWSPLARGNYHRE